MAENQNEFVHSPNIENSHHARSIPLPHPLLGPPAEFLDGYTVALLTPFLHALRRPSCHIL